MHEVALFMHKPLLEQLKGQGAGEQSMVVTSGIVMVENLPLKTSSFRYIKVIPKIEQDISASPKSIPTSLGFHT